MKCIRIGSVDIPWGAANFVGYAGAHLDDGLISKLYAGAVQTTPPLSEDIDSFPSDRTEIATFIEYGVADGCLRDFDERAPFAYLPQDNASRERHLTRLWSAFRRLRRQLEIGELDLLMIDVPLIPAENAQSAPYTDRFAQFRPVELAFHNKVMIPGNNPRRRDGRVQMAKFQAGFVSGYRPGLAIAALAQIAFGAEKVVESFPQLVIGPLAELASCSGLPLIRRLAAHKNGNQASKELGQEILKRQISHFLQQNDLNFDAVPIGGRPDMVDAILAILPALVHMGFQPALPEKDGANTSWTKAVLLRNLGHDANVQGPRSGGPGEPAIGCRNWICESPIISSGINPYGILTLNLSLWG